MPHVWLHTVADVCRDGVESFADRLKQLAPFLGVKQYQRAPLVVGVERRVGLLPSPEVGNGDVAWAMEVGEVALSA